MQKYSEKGDIIPIAAFRDILRDAFKDYVIRLDEVRSYKGPVLEIEEESYGSFYGSGTKLKKVKYAADVTIWRPIKREAEKRAKKARESSPSSYSGGYQSPMTIALKALKAAGIDVPVRKSSGQFDTKFKEGETEIFGSNGWASGIHPRTLLDHLDASTLIKVQSSYGEGKLATTDAAAVAAAREAYRSTVAEVSKKILAPLAEKLSDKVLAGYLVSGPGARSLIDFLEVARGDGKTIAMTIGVDLGAELSQADAERLLAALAACGAQKIKVPNSWTIEDKIRQAVGNPAFKVAKAVVPVAPKSKKQQKRDSRAAGKQVGDPSRAKNMRPGGRLATGPVVKVGESLGVDVVRDATPEEIEAGELVEA
jgi:hypothetical protein